MAGRVGKGAIGCSKQLLQNQFVIRAFLRRETNNRGEKKDTMKTIMEIITVKVIARQLPNKDQVQGCRQKGKVQDIQ